MQELLSSQPSSSPYTPAGGSTMGAASPQSAVNTASGSTIQQPSALQSGAQTAAQHTQSFGRGEDSMLVHMTPDEVNSLRGLAQQFGGDLTQNPHTGLPEAGWLGKLLPTLLGVAGMAFGIPPIWMGALGAVGGTVATGDLGKGLMMGLGAFGGASMAGGLGLAGKISSNALGAMGSAGSGVTGAAGTVASAASKAPAALAGGAGAAPLPNTALQALNATGTAAKGLPAALAHGAGSLPIANGALAAAQNAAVAAPSVAGASSGGLGGLMQGFNNSARMGTSGIVSKVAAPLATTGLIGGVSNALSPSSGQVTDPSSGAVDNSYQGPYKAQERHATFSPASDLLSSSAEHKYFDVDIPEVYNGQGQMVQPGSATKPGAMLTQPVLNPKAKKGQNMYSFETSPWMQEQNLQPQAPWMAATGGEVPSDVFHMESGGHVMPAKTVAAFGNFSTDAGQQKLAAMGGIPIRGQGDGVSDSIPARIDGNQEARVANGEVYFPPKAVQKMGGSDKLYAMMKRAERAANQTKNGERVRGLA